MSKREEADSGLRAGFISEDEALRKMKEDVQTTEQVEESAPEPVSPVAPEKRVDPQDDGPTIEMKGISGKSITSVIKIVKKSPTESKEAEAVSKTEDKTATEPEMPEVPQPESAEKPEPATEKDAATAVAAKPASTKKKSAKASEAKSAATKTAPAVKDTKASKDVKQAQAAQDKKAAKEAVASAPPQKEKVAPTKPAPAAPAAVPAAESEASGDGVLRDTGVVGTKRVTGAPIRPQSGSYIGRDADAPAVSKKDSRAERHSRVAQPPREERRRRDERQTGSRPPAGGRTQTRDRRQDVAFADKDREEAPRRTRSPKQVARQQPLRQPEDAKAATRSHYAQKSQHGRRQESRRDQTRREKEEMLTARMRRRAPRNQPTTEQQKQAQILTKVKLPSSLTVKELSEALKKTTSEVIMKLMSYGVMATLNQEIDYDTAEIIANEFEIKAEKLVEVTAEEILFDDSPDDEADLQPRPPVVVVMGHVDHGKTSILDYIREASVASGEAGGITQKIGAYTVDVGDQQITFIDTPGHEAFTTMRARGAQVTDLAVLVVAADDGVMPQTIEAIHHARAANTEILVAINKIDKANINIDRVLTELAQHDLIGPEWGGSTTIVKVSAKTGENMDELLSMILLTAEVLELKANPNRQAKGTVIEAKLDRARGVVATLLVQRGTLSIGDTIVVGSQIGHVRAMHNDKGKPLDVAGPSTPVEVMGLSEVPEGGEVFYEVEDDRTARALVERRKEQERESALSTSSRMSLDNLFASLGSGEVKELNIIVKADLKGSVEALTSSLEKLSNEEVQVRVIHGAVGAITESDIRLAEVANAIVIGFSVRPAPNVPELAEASGVDIRLYRVIYHATEDIENAMKGMLEPEFKEVVLGHATVREVFRISGVGSVAGCYVTSGKIVRNSEIRVVRDGIVIHEGNIDSLRRFKDDVREVAAGYECGIGIERFNDIREGDQFESFEVQEIKRD
ncbi:MAG: translation initiation factor IF-2 [Saccharofermentanales bacterium]|jgi:translation initiation factor IF-2|nr:translation initiation factor IF-2 [Bacillota bacterium]